MSFVKLRRGLLEHLVRLSANAAKLYLFLLMQVEPFGVDKGVYRSTTRAISEDLGMNRRAVLNALGELEHLAPKPFIVIERASNQHKLTAYRVLRFSSDAGAESAPAESRSAGTTSAPAPTPADLPKQFAINGLGTPKNLENKNTVKSVELRPVKNGSYPSWFELLWTSYPSRKGAKKPAFKQAAKVITSDGDAELALRYLAIRASHIERMKARGAFVENLPHVERYFSRGLWNQEPEIAAQDGDGFKRSWE